MDSIKITPNNFNPISIWESTYYFILPKRYIDSMVDIPLYFSLNKEGFKNSVSGDILTRFLFHFNKFEGGVLHC